MHFNRLVRGAAFLLLTLCFGCTVNNNYLKPEDFAARLTEDGVRIEGIRRLDPTPLSATEAVELKVAGSGIGVYKFDNASKVQRRRLERLNKERTVYLNGIPYPIYEVSGSFIVVGLDKNKEKQRILQSLRKFK